MLRNVTKVLVAGALLAGAQLSFAQEARPMLTQATAKKMADACEKYARDKGWKIIIAIVDSGGQLKHFTRMDDSFLISVGISQTKANTSAGVPVSSRKFGEIAKTMAPGIEFTPNTATFPGGLPIMAGKAHVGGIGVSGATGDQDEECAQVALDAVKDDLK